MDEKTFAARLLHLMARERGLNIEYRGPAGPDDPAQGKWVAFNLGFGVHVWEAETWRGVEDALNYVAKDSPASVSWSIDLATVAATQIDEGPMNEGGIYLSYPRPTRGESGDWTLAARSAES